MRPYPITVVPGSIPKMILLFSIFGITCNILEIVKHKKFRQIFGATITVAFLIHTYFYFQNNSSLLLELKTSLKHFQSGDIFIKVLVLLFFSLTNWTLESYKWQFLSKDITKLDFKTAVRDVLCGLAISNFFPKSASDVVGRIGATKEQNRWQMLGAMVINNSSQLSVTVFFGLLSLFYVWQDFFDSYPWFLIFVSALFVTVVALIFVFNDWLVFQIEKFAPRFLNSLKAIQEYSPHSILWVFFLSLMRYISFLMPLILTLYFLGQESSVITFLIPISLIYFTKAMIPGFNFLVDLGVKQYSHVYFLSYAGVSTPDALLAGLIIWLFNTFLPSLMGIFLVWRR